jgi:hypothetical protein
LPGIFPFVPAEIRVSSGPFAERNSAELGWVEDQPQRVIGPLIFNFAFLIFNFTNA